MKKVFAVLLVCLMLFLPISVSAQLAPASAPQSESALQQFLNSPDLKVVVGKDAAASDQKIANDLYQQYSYNIREKILDQQRSSEKDIVPGKFLIAEDTDYLELNETLGEVLSSVGTGHTPMLQGKWVNTKVDKSYQTQSIQFPNTSSTSVGNGGGKVIFTKNEFEEVGTFLHWLSGEEVYTYTLQFEPGLKSEADGTMTSQLADFIDRSFNIAGREYFVVNSKLFNSTKGSGVGMELVLAHGAVQDEIGEGQVKTYAVGNKAYKVEAMIVSEDNREVLFKVNGETLPKLRVGELAPLKDGTVLSVRDVIRTRKDVQQTVVRFYIAPEFGELRIRDGDINDRTYETESLRINGELQDNTDVIVRGVSANNNAMSGIGGSQNPTIIIIDRIQFRLKNKGMMDGNIYLKQGQKISETQMDPESFKTFFDIKYDGNTNAKPLPQLKDDLRKKYAQQTLFGVNFKGNLEFEQLADVGGSRIGSTITVKHDKCDLLPQQAQAAENLAQRAKDLGKEDVAKEYTERKLQLEKEYREDCLYGPQVSAPEPETKPAEATKPILPSDAEVKSCVEQKQAGSVYLTAKKSLENANTEHAKKNFLDKISALSEDFARDCKSDLTQMPEMKKEEKAEKNAFDFDQLPECGSADPVAEFMCQKDGVKFSVVTYRTDGSDLYFSSAAYGKDNKEIRVYKDIQIGVHDKEDLCMMNRNNDAVHFYEDGAATGTNDYFNVVLRRDNTDTGRGNCEVVDRQRNSKGDIIFLVDYSYPNGLDSASATNDMTLNNRPQNRADGLVESPSGSKTSSILQFTAVKNKGSADTPIYQIELEDLAEYKIVPGSFKLVQRSEKERKFDRQLSETTRNDDGNAGTVEYTFDLNFEGTRGECRGDPTAGLNGLGQFICDLNNDDTFSTHATESSGFSNANWPLWFSAFTGSALLPVQYAASYTVDTSKAPTGFDGSANIATSRQRLYIATFSAASQFIEKPVSAIAAVLYNLLRIAPIDGNSPYTGSTSVPGTNEFPALNNLPIFLDGVSLMGTVFRMMNANSEANFQEAFTDPLTHERVFIKWIYTPGVMVEIRTPGEGFDGSNVKVKIFMPLELNGQGTGVTLADVSLQAQSPATQQGQPATASEVSSQTDFVLNFMTPEEAEAKDREARSKTLCCKCYVNTNNAGSSIIVSEVANENECKKVCSSNNLDGSKITGPYDANTCVMGQNYPEQTLLEPVLSNNNVAVVNKANVVLAAPTQAKTEPGETMQSNNLLIIGGPCANEAARVLLGLSCADYLSNFPVGETLIHAVKRFNDKVALVVAGTNAQDTSDAVNALQSYQFNPDYVATKEQDLIVQ